MERVTTSTRGRVRPARGADARARRQDRRGCSRRHASSRHRRVGAGDASIHRSSWASTAGARATRALEWAAQVLPSVRRLDGEELGARWRTCSRRNSPETPPPFEPRTWGFVAAQSSHPALEDPSAPRPCRARLLDGPARPRKTARGQRLAAMHHRAARRGLLRLGAPLRADRGGLRLRRGGEDARGEAAPWPRLSSTRRPTRVPPRRLREGAGPTPYARDGEARAVLRSASASLSPAEAMGALGCRTGGGARSGATSSDTASYSSRTAAAAACALVIPVQGRIQLAIPRGGCRARAGGLPAWDRSGGSGRRERRAASRARCRVATRCFVEDRAAQLQRNLAAWQALAVARVLNTDNMSVLGLTLDYGPFAFVERFDPNFTPNLSLVKHIVEAFLVVGRWPLESATVRGRADARRARVRAPGEGSGGRVRRTPSRGVLRRAEGQVRRALRTARGGIFSSRVSPSAPAIQSRGFYPRAPRAGTRRSVAAASGPAARSDARPATRPWRRSRSVPGRSCDDPTLRGKDEANGSRLGLDAAEPS